MAKMIDVLYKGVVKKVPEKTAKMMERYFGGEILVDELPAGVAPPKPLIQPPKLVKPAEKLPVAGDPMTIEAKADVNPNEPVVVPARAPEEKAPAKTVKIGKPKKAKSNVAAHKS